MKISEFNLEELDFDNIGYLPIQIKTIITSIMFLLGLFIGIFIFCKADLIIYSNKNSEQLALKKSFSEKFHRSQNSNEYQEQIIEIRKYTDNLSKKLPKQKQFPMLLENISEQALFANVSLKSIRPGKKKTSIFYVEQPLQIIVNGKYHEFGKFISGISALPRVVTLHDLSIRNINKSKDTDSENLEMKIEAKIYWYE